MVSKCQLGDPTGTLWAVVFTQDEIRRAATGSGALSTQREPQGVRDTVRPPQAQEAGEEVGEGSHPNFLPWLVQSRLIAGHCVTPIGRKVKGVNTMAPTLIFFHSFIRSVSTFVEPQVNALGSFW